MNRILELDLPKDMRARFERSLAIQNHVAAKLYFEEGRFVPMLYQEIKALTGKHGVSVLSTFFLKRFKSVFLKQSSFAERNQIK